MIRRSKGALKEAFVLFVLVLPRWWWLRCVMPERRILKHMCSNGLRVFRERISRPRPPSWDPLAAHSSASSSRSRGRRSQCPLYGGGGYCMGVRGGAGGVKVVDWPHPSGHMLIHINHPGTLSDSVEGRRRSCRNSGGLWEGLGGTPETG